jgi:hypothetical protein
MNVTRSVDQATELRHKTSGPSVAAVIESISAKELEDLGPEDDAPSTSAHGSEEQAETAAALTAAGSVSTLEVAPLTASAQPSPTQPAETQHSPPTAEKIGTTRTAEGSRSGTTGAAEQSVLSDDIPVDPQEQAVKGSIDAYLAQHGVVADKATEGERSLHDSDLEINSECEDVEEQQEQSKQKELGGGRSQGNGYWDEEDELEDMLNKEKDGE